MNIGERIKQRRLELGLSVDELASKLGKNRATVYRYENNEIENLPITLISVLAKALETTPSYLMGWDDVEEQDALIDKYYDTHPDEDINEPTKEALPLEIRAAARDIMDLSPEDQKTAMDMIKFLSQKGKEAKDN